jgi:hypothetical protein
MTLGITVALTAYACTTKTDVTMCGGTLFILVMALMMFGMFASFYEGGILYKIYCLLGVILYGYFIIYDTQLIVGGKRY